MSVSDRFCGFCGQVEAGGENGSKKPLKKGAVWIIIASAAVLTGLILFCAIGRPFSAAEAGNGDALGLSLEAGIRLLSEGKYEEAILEFNHVLAIDPKVEEAYVLVASAYEKLGQREAAAEAVEKGLGQLPQSEALAELLAEYRGAEALPENDHLKTSDFIEYTVSAPDGSGAVSVITIQYLDEQGHQKSVELNLVSRFVAEVAEQRLYEDPYLPPPTYMDVVKSSDFDEDGIFELIAYHEMWYSDLGLSHVSIKRWPVVYEVDTKNGTLVVETARNSAYLEKYFIPEMETNLDYSGIKKDGNGFYHLDSRPVGEDFEKIVVLSMIRMHTTALLIVRGEFIPKDLYNTRLFEDIDRIGREYVPH